MLAAIHAVTDRARTALLGLCDSDTLVLGGCVHVCIRYLSVCTPLHLGQLQLGGEATPMGNMVG